jgi:hypothetical protein
MVDPNLEGVLARDQRERAVVGSIKAAFSDQPLPERVPGSASGRGAPAPGDAQRT